MPRTMAGRGGGADGSDGPATTGATSTKTRTPSPFPMTCPDSSPVPTEEIDHRLRCDLVVDVIEVGLFACIHHKLCAGVLVLMVMGWWRWCPTGRGSAITALERVIAGEGLVTLTVGTSGYYLLLYSLDSPPHPPTDKTFS